MIARRPAASFAQAWTSFSAGATVVVEGLGLFLFTGRTRMEPVDGNRAREDDLRHTAVTCSVQVLAGRRDIDLVIERDGPDVVPMLGREVINEVHAIHGALDQVAVTDVADEGKASRRTGMAVENPDLLPSRQQHLG